MLMIWKGSLVEKLLFLSWFVLGWVLPIVTIFAHQSQHITFPVACFLFFCSAFLLVGHKQLWYRALGLCQQPWLQILTLLLCWAFASTLWSSLQIRTFSISLSLLGIGFGAFLLALSAPFVVRSYSIYVLLSGLCLTLFLFLIEIKSGMMMRASFGLRLETFLFNRGAVTVSILLLPCLLALFYNQKRGLALIILSFALFVIFQMQSGTAQFVMLIGLLGFVAKLFGARWLLVFSAILFFLTVALSPYIFMHLSAFFPEKLLAILQNTHADERLKIWHGFANAIDVLSPLGHGLENSWIALQLPSANVLTENDFKFIGFGHPHNFALQLWYELGFIGVGLFIGFGILLLKQLSNAETHVQKYHFSLIAFLTISAVMMVSHGAWQPWWISTIGSGVFLYYVMALNHPNEKVANEHN